MWAVVLLQADGAGVRVVLLEVQDVLDVGATPGVDGLVVVADDHEVPELGGQQVGDGVLDVVGVLVLVDADLEEAVLVALENARVLGEQLVGLDQQVVKVHGVGLGQADGEGAVDAAGGAVGRVGGALQLGGTNHGVLCRGDLGADTVDGELLLVDSEVVHDALDQSL